MPIRVRVDIKPDAVAGVLSGSDIQHRMDNAAQAALRMQVALVPVDTGKLSQHLEIRKVGNGRQVGAFNVEYAIYVEEGHHTESGSWVPAQPFVRPSIDAVRGSLRNA